MTNRVAVVTGAAQGIGRRTAEGLAADGDAVALVGLTRTLAVEWGGRGVRANAVCPGWVKTEMDVASQASGAYGDADITDHVPAGRFATPDDIAQAVAFLADPARSGFVNGTTLSVDGGLGADGPWPAPRPGAPARQGRPAPPPD